MLPSVIALLLSVGAVIADQAPLCPAPNEAVCRQSGCPPPSTQVTDSTLIIEQDFDVDAEWPSIDGGSAELIDTSIENGKTIGTFAITKPTTVFIPSSPPTPGPGGVQGVWTVVTTKITQVAGPGKTLIYDQLALTTAPYPCATVTETASAQTVTQTTSVTSTTTLPAETITTTLAPLTSTITLPPVTSTTTSTTTSISLLPPVTITSISTLPPVTTTTTVTAPPVTSVSTFTSVSVSTSTTTTTSYAPPTTTTVTSPPVTTTVTTTITADPGPSCLPGLTQQVTSVNVRKGAPFTYTTSDYFPTVLNIIDAGYRSERYSVSVDGANIGSTSAIAADRNVYCGINPVAYDSCVIRDLSRGSFNIPGGQHTVTITNIPGVYDDNAATDSTLFYSIERRCPGLAPPSPPACSQTLIQNWATTSIPANGSPATIALNYAYPVLVTLVDGGYRTDKYMGKLDGVDLGWTSAYTPDQTSWCATTLDNNGPQKCLDMGMSWGSYVIPAGNHNVAFTQVQFTGNPSWTASTAFYKIEKYCPK